MDLAVMEGFPALIYSAGSSTPTTTTTTTCTDDDISWDSNWSPHALYWSHEGLNPFSNKFEIPFSEGSPADPCFASSPSPVFQNCSSDSGSDPDPFHGEDSGKRQRLLHLLIAAAEALSGDLNGRDLARVILVRLKELATSATEMGIDRLAGHFTDALFSLLNGGDTAAPFRYRYPAAEALTASQLFQDMSPFASFGRLTANQAILEAFAGERRVHIVDYDVGDGVQWASLIQAMASQKDGPPAPHLKITAMTSCSRRSASEAHEAGRRLSAFAASVGQPFAFRLCRFDQQKRFQPASVKVVRGEPVAVNCVLHPGLGSHGDGSAASVFSFLSGAAALGARVVSIVEEEGAEKGGFLERFAVELERYMAVWEALEAEFPKQGRVREMVERAVLGPRIAGAVRKAYGRSDGCGTAAEWMAALGFKRVGLSFANLCQAKLLLGLFSDGYKVDEDGLNKIGLSWKSRRLVSASVWAAQTRRSASP